jgi:hypothetical protein
MFPASVLTLDGSGRGNNWAHGYTESAGLDAISDEYRKVVEQDSRLGGTMMLSSVGKCCSLVANIQLAEPVLASDHGFWKN